MKISTIKDIVNKVYKVSIATSDFSQADVTGMVDFGEPVVNVGGDLGLKTAATVVGTVGLAAGYDWSGAGEEDFSILLPYMQNAAHIVLQSNCADLTEVLAEINLQLVAAGVTAVEAYPVADTVGLRTTATGSATTFTLTEGTAHALTTLGIVAGVYTGTAEWHLADDLKLVSSDSPLTQGFDARDAVYPGEAESKANTWASELAARIQIEIDVLRANIDNFSGETVITY